MDCDGFPMTFNPKKMEVEFKYDASDVSLAEFNTFSRSLNPVKVIEAYSWDHYYAATDPNAKVEFLRFRKSTFPQLTLKVKLDEKNNNQRIEVDLPLDGRMSDLELQEYVDLFCEQMGFKLNFSIFKYCSIFFYEKYDTVHYTVFNENMKETGRFMEIEARKDYPFQSLEEANQVVREVEQSLSPLGISPQKRQRLSMWERFRRTDK